MASRLEVSKIRLPQHVEQGVAKVYDAALANEGAGYGRVTRDLRQYMIDTVVEDDSVHPVAKASLVASVDTPLVDSTDHAAKYHPIPVTQRKLTAMRAFLSSMRPDSIVLLRDNIAMRNTDDPQLVGDTSVADTEFARLRSSVMYRYADIADVNIGTFDPFDIGLRRDPLQAKDGVITIDGTSRNAEYVLKFLTGVEQYGDSRVSASARIGVARDGELYDYIASLYAADPEPNTSKVYPSNILNGLAASVAVMAVSEGRNLAVPIMVNEELREEYRKQISHTIVSLAMREVHEEGVDETRYCCPSHGNQTSFRRRQNEIAQWTTEQLGIVLRCLDFSVEDLVPERKHLGLDSSIGEVISDVINHEAVDATFRELRLRLA